MPHLPVFRYAVLIDGKKAGEGSGASKREAQQNAAAAALQKLTSQNSRRK